MSFIGVLGRLLIVLAAWSWYQTEGFDQSRIALATRNEQLLYRVVSKGGWALAVISLFFLVIAFFLLLAALAGASSSQPRRRRRYYDNWW